MEINISSIQRKRIAQTFAGIMEVIEEENEEKLEEQSPSPLSTDCDPSNESNRGSGSVDEGDNALNFEMFTLLDKACIEILLLMRQSYERFAARSVQILKQLPDTVEMIDYRNQAVKMEILRDGESYAKLREKYGA